MLVGLVARRQAAAPGYPQDAGGGGGCQLQQVRRIQFATNEDAAYPFEHVARAGEPRIGAQSQPTGFEKPAWIDRSAEECMVAGRAPDNGGVALDHAFDIRLAQA